MDRPASPVGGRAGPEEWARCANRFERKKMTRNLKVLGIALAAVFAMSAVAASTASAQLGKITADGPVTLKGTETGAALENSFTVTVLGSTTALTCPGSTYTGHTKATTPHKPLHLNATEVTVTPHYKQPCEDNKGNKDVTVNMNGCDYVFRDATTTGGVAGTFGIVVDIVCPAGKVIEVTGSVCTVKVGPQTGLTGFHLTHTPSPADDIDLSGTVNVAVTACGLNVTSVYHADVTIKGVSEAGSDTPVTITD
jgi:hypothetical protein